MISVPPPLHEQSCKHAAPSDSLHARHVWTRVQDYPGHVWTRGGQVLLYHIYTLRTPPQMSGSGGATCLKNRVWEQTLEIIKNNIQQKQSTQTLHLHFTLYRILRSLKFALWPALKLLYVKCISVKYLYIINKRWRFSLSCVYKKCFVFKILLVKISTVNLLILNFRISKVFGANILWIGKSFQCVCYAHSI